ncbi:PD40 domain-containing protein [Solimonas soli]|uniref:PD40 domain-containing protein n=1 Tax=Solimonas soli TaxID=413479 RepID=UPI0004B29B6C|nr:PD40 domain-containing protein [Solimonas soli]
MLKTLLNTPLTALLAALGLTALPAAAADAVDIAPGSKIAYIDVESGGNGRHWRLLIAEADGSAPRAVMRSDALLMSPAWSPDRQRIAVVAYDRGQAGLYLYELASGVIRRLTSLPNINGSPAWSPDGNTLAMTISDGKGNADIALVDPRRGARTFDDVRRLTDSPAIDTEAAWSPDGRSIAFTSDRSGTPQIWLMNADGSEQRMLTREGQNMRPRWSPDGKSIAHVSSRDGQLYIALSRISTGRTEPLTQGPRDIGPSFSPTGDALLYSQSGHLALLALDGVPRVLTSTATEVQETDWVR